ncbi:MAG: hypothetical protein ACXAD7_11365 [Candidatus Kariarchaeaceae archaeon]|jgi:hypothetical protein
METPKKPEISLIQLLFLGNYFLVLGIVVIILAEMGKFTASEILLFFLLYGVFVWFLLTYEKPGALVLLLGTLEEDLTIDLSHYFRLQIYLLGLNLILFLAIILAPVDVFSLLSFYPILLFMGLFVYFILTNVFYELKSTIQWIGSLLFFVGLIIGTLDVAFSWLIPIAFPNLGILLGLPIVFATIIILSE